MLIYHDLSTNMRIEFRNTHKFEKQLGARLQDKHMGVSENSVPLKPMVLLIIIPMKNCYFLLGILTQHFQVQSHIEEPSGKPCLMHHLRTGRNGFFEHLAWCKKTLLGWISLDLRILRHIIKPFSRA